MRRDAMRVRVLVLEDRAGGRALRALRPALAIVDTIAADLVAPHLRVLRASGTRVVALALMSHGAPSLARQADRTIAPSAALAADLIAAGIPGSRISVIAPGTDRASRVAARTDGTRVLCVANWSAAKGITTLLAAAKRVPDVRIALVGDAGNGWYAARVRALAAHPELAGRVRVRGALGPGALEREYRRASVFALPSTRESYGMAVAEAMAHGLPVIACDIPASRELASGAALLVPPRRVATLAAALDVLTRDGRLRRDLGRLTRARSRTLPTWAQSERALVRAVRAEL